MPFTFYFFKITSDFLEQNRALKKLLILWCIVYFKKTVRLSNYRIKDNIFPLADEEQNAKPNDSNNSIKQPYFCYHCEKRFAQKTHLKKHELVHRGEKLVKVMKHPFFVKGDEGKEEEIKIDDKIVQIMAKESMPFIPRNLPKSLKDQLDLPKGKVTF